MLKQTILVAAMAALAACLVVLLGLGSDIAQIQTGHEDITDNRSQPEAAKVDVIDSIPSTPADEELPAETAHAPNGQANEGPDPSLADALFACDVETLRKAVAAMSTRGLTGLLNDSLLEREVPECAPSTLFAELPLDVLDGLDDAALALLVEQNGCSVNDLYERDVPSTQIAVK